MRVSLRLGALCLFLAGLAGCGHDGGFSPAGTVQSQARGATQHRVSPDAGYANIYGFQDGNDGATPEGALLYSHGTFYGNTAAGGTPAACYSNCGTVFTMTQAGASWSEKVIYTFKGGADGDNAYTGLIADNKGELFGGSLGGGTSCECGTIYKLKKSDRGWKHTVLYTFQGGTDGGEPNPLYLDPTTGTMYGTTYYGGGSTACSVGCGTFFSLTRSGTGYAYKPIYAFKGGADAGNPTGGLTVAPGGVFYGTSLVGGSKTTACPEGCGTIFKLVPTGKSYRESILYRFHDGKDGRYPYGGLIFGGSAATTSVLFGTTAGGGDLVDCVGADHYPGCGTVFSAVVSGKSAKTTVVYKFKGYQFNDGSVPVAALAANRTTIYGTTSSGGAKEGSDYGTLWSLTYSGKYTLMHTFTSGADGANAGNPVTLAAGGIVGTTLTGGGSTNCGFSGCGAAFAVTP